MLKKIAECCPNLHELNLTSTYISDEGLMSLCGANRCDGVRKCQKLQRLTITETRTTWMGAYAVIQNLPNLTDFDFDRIFQVPVQYLHLDWAKSFESWIEFWQLLLLPTGFWTLGSQLGCLSTPSTETKVALLYGSLYSAWQHWRCCCVMSKDGGI